MRTESVASEVRWILRRRVPSGLDAERFDDALRLGSPGLGLDSVAVVEVLLACERRFGVKLPIALLEEGPLTVGRLVQRIEESVSDSSTP